MGGFEPPITDDGQAARSGALLRYPSLSVARRLTPPPRRFSLASRRNLSASTFLPQKLSGYGSRSSRDASP